MFACQILRQAVTDTWQRRSALPSLASLYPEKA